MLFRFLLLATIAVASTWAEAPFAKSAPYPASGWRPDVPFNLPGEAEQQQQEQPQVVDVEIKKQRVDFIGQVQENAFEAAKQPQSAYLPPRDSKDNDFIKTQQLPYDKDPQFFRKQNFAKQQPQQQQFGQRLQPKARPQQQQFFPDPQRPSPQYSRPAQQYGAPLTDEQNQQQYTRPAQQYGAPYKGQNLNIVYPDPRSLDENVEAEDDSDAKDNRAAIEALNTAVEAYNRAQANRNAVETQDESAVDENDYTEEANAGYAPRRQPARFNKGQYYVLAPDNTIQRVMFTTSQDEEQKRSNDFTAQLKYMSVGEVRDPVFKYNNRGQLVRLFKK